MTDRPRRVHVVGNSGSGKSTLAARVARRTGWARLDLDEVFWDADWTYRDPDEARAAVRAFVAMHPSWVADGNWTSRLGGLLEPGADGGADLVVWLDPPRARLMRRIVLRTLRRGLTGEKLWHGNREDPRSWLRWDPAENIVRWAWVNHAAVRERMSARIAAGDPVLRLRSDAEVGSWLASLPPVGAHRPPPT